MESRQTAGPPVPKLRLFDHFQAETKQINWSQAIRGTLALALPMAVGLLLGHFAWGTIMGLSSYFVLLADNGGTYRQKARAMVASALAILVAFDLGEWFARSPIGLVLGSLFWFSATAYLGLAGNAAAQAGFFSSLMLIVAPALALPAPPQIRYILCAAGALWAILLSLILWPVRAFTPLFEATAACFASAGELLSLVRGEGGFDRFALVHDQVSRRIAQARSAWATIRTRRSGPTTRSVQLILLIERAAGILKDIVEVRNSASRFENPGLEKAVEATFAQMSAALRSVGVSIAHRGQIPAEVSGVDARIRDLVRVVGLIALELSGSPDDLAKLARIKYTVRSLQNVAGSIADAVALVNTLPTGRRPGSIPDLTERLRATGRTGLSQILRSNLSLRSAGFRHAIRLGIVGAFAQILSLILPLPRGYWITITVLVVLKPNFGGTMQRAIQRTVGTTAGAIVAIVLTIWVRDPWALVFLLAFLTFCTFAVRSINFALFTLMVTPTFMVMLEVLRPGAWDLSVYRLLHTLFGGALAVAAGYWLFPLWEARNQGVALAESIRATGEFLRAIGQESADQNEIAATERQAGQLVADVGMAVQRYLGEPAHIRGDLVPVLSAVTLIREIYFIATSLAATTRSAGLIEPTVRGFIRTVATALSDLAQVLQDKLKPEKTPDLVTLYEEAEERQTASAAASVNAKSLRTVASRDWEMARCRDLMTYFGLLADTVRPMAWARAAIDPAGRPGPGLAEPTR